MKCPIIQNRFIPCEYEGDKIRAEKMSEQKKEANVKE